MSEQHTIHMTDITDTEMIVTVAECKDLRAHIGHDIDCASAEWGAALYCVTCDTILAYTEASELPDDA